MWPAGSVGGSQFMMVVSDDSLIRVSGCTPVGSFDDKLLTYLAIQDIETVQACTGNSFTIKPAEVAEAHTVSIVFVELNIGVWRTTQVSFTANELSPLPPLSNDTDGSLMGD